MFRRATGFLLCCLLPVLVHAQELVPNSPELPEEVTASLSAVKSGDIAPEKLVRILPYLGTAGVRERLREAVAAAKEFPRLTFVVHLTHSDLAVRMGALEFLEEAAGGDFGFSPWIAPGAPDNRGPVSRWRAWAGESGPVALAGRLSEDRKQSCLREILAGDPDKSSRARRLLEGDGLRALEFLEAFLASTPELPEPARVRIREAEYQIVLARRFGPQAGALARDLTTGSRDQLLSALVTIRQAGMEALPVMRDFLAHADPLVRETAIDSYLLTGREAALTAAVPLIAAEKDVNVVHGALRRLRDIPGATALDLARGFLTHPDEDLLVSALQTCQTLSGGNKSHSSDGNPVPIPDSLRDAVLPLLSDTRWRVRTAALEFVAALRVNAAGGAVLKLLEDSDTFVRFAAVKAAGALSLKNSVPVLRRMFFADEGMIGPVIDGYGTLSVSLDDEMTAHLRKASVDVRVAAVRSMEAHESRFLAEATAFAADSDPDVACAALRFLASDDDRLEVEAVQKVVLAAMEGTDPVRAAAVFGSISLPRNSKIQTVTVRRPAGKATSLDPLYRAFLDPLEKSAGGSGVEPGVSDSVVSATIRAARRQDSPLAWPAALALANGGWPQAWGPIVAMMPGLTTSQKSKAADCDGTPSGPDCVTFFSAMLKDPVQEVRETAAASLLKHASAVPAFASMVFGALDSGAVISPAALPGYNFNDVIRSSSVSGIARTWALERIDDAKVPMPLRVFAALILEVAPTAGAVPVLLRAARSPDSTWLRRAAWHALAKQDRSGLAPWLDEVLNDSEVPVRLVLPDVLSTASSTWNYQFDDLQKLPVKWYESGWSSPRVPGVVEVKALETMAFKDPSAVVRFEAQFALLTLRKEVDLDEFLSLMSRQPPGSKARQRITDWLSSSSASAGPGLRPLLAVIDQERISANDYRTLAYILGAEPSGFQSFNELAKNSGAGQPQHVATADDRGSAAARTSLPVIFFHKPGCEECRRTRELLTSLRSSFPSLTVLEYNIMEASATVLNQALCARFSVPVARHTVTPAIFSQAGFAVRDDITPEAAGALLERTVRLPQDDAWLSVSAGESAAAAAEVERRYDSLTLSVVIIAGLLDGINPCAFATIILFLSWLQVAKRSPREMLLTGAAFILAVFLAYLAAGLVLYQVLAGLSRFTWIQKWMNGVFAAFALFAAFLSFRDAWRAGVGRMDEMSLKLPEFIRNRIRSAIRTGAKARRFIIAAFVTGLIVSLLELACTGQVYAPIIYQIQNGRSGAIGWLVLYNLAFILPLTVIFLLTWVGLRSEHLVAFQKKHTRAVKIALGVLFTLLALLILFGERWLH